MSRIAWPKLMRLGLRDLALSPAVFWDLTPAELFLLAGAGSEGGALSRSEFETLIARFPDAGRAQTSQED